MAIYTDEGEADVVDRIDGTVTATGFFMAWGSGTTTETKTATSLTSSGAATESYATTVLSQPSADINQFVGTLTIAAATKDIHEFALYTGSTSATGIMMIRHLHGTQSLATEDAIQYTASLEQT